MMLFDHYRSDALCAAMSDQQYDFGSRPSLEECARACQKHAGCNYFAYGKGAKSGRCLWQLDAACLTQEFDESGWVVLKRAPAPAWIVEVPEDAVFNQTGFV